jgi:hypothetical protein
MMAYLHLHMRTFECVMMFLVNKSCCSVVVISVVDMDLRLKHPFCLILSGGTGSGKTVFTFKLISEAQRMITPPPEKIIYCYGEFQEIFNDYPEVEFTEGLPDISQFDGSHRTLLIIDDLLSETNHSVEKIFTKKSHHCNISVLYLSQNLFYKGKHNRTISLNTHYMVLFKNPRDLTQITVLSRQMYPGYGKFLVEAFRDATKEPYGYLLIDLKPDTDDRYRIRTKIFPSDERQYAYVPK